MSERLMLTAAEVGVRLALSARMVYGLAASGTLTGYRFGRAVRFDAADVEAYRTSCRSVGTPETSATASSSSVSLKVSGSELAAFFRAAGVKLRPTPSTAVNARAYAAAAVAAEREACAKLCDQTPPYPFRPSIEAAHAIRARATD